MAGGKAAHYREKPLVFEREAGQKTLRGKRLAQTRGLHGDLPARKGGKTSWNLEKVDSRPQKKKNLK